MRWKIALIGLVLFAAYTGLNYYIGLRGAQTFNLQSAGVAEVVWWSVFWFYAYLYIGVRFVQRWLPPVLKRVLTRVGSYWIAAMVYFLIITGIADLLRAGMVLTGFSYGSKTNTAGIVLGGIACTAVAVLLLYGSINASSPRTVQYRVSMPPNPDQSVNIQPIHAVMVSDIHLGTIIGRRVLEKLVCQIIELKPDIVFFVGDLIDEDVNHFVDERMDETLRRIKPPLGTYAVLGNHEYFGGQLTAIVDHLEDSGIHVLRDQGKMIDSRFFLLGREDVVSQRFLGKDRKNLQDLLSDVDPRSIPVVVLDHQPKTWGESAQAGVHLQLSGHTHRGQFFPFGWITRWLFDEDGGKLTEKSGQTLIVSTGYGTWGPPVRIGNQPELVSLMLEFGT